MNKISHILVILTLLAARSGFCQDASANRSINPVSGMIDQLKSAQNIALKVKVETYSESASGAPAVFYVEMKKSGENMRYYMMDRLMLVTSSMQVEVHKARKLIRVSNRRKSNFSDLSSNILPVQSDADVYTDAGADADGHHFILKSQDGVFSRTDVWIDDSTGLLKKIDYQNNPRYYPEGGRVVLTYEVFDLNPIFPNDEFSLDKIVVLNSGKYQPSESFRGFVVDQQSLMTKTDIENFLTQHPMD